MKTLTAILLLFFGGMNLLQAQENFSHQWGKVTQYEMTMTAYEKDTDAEALVIYEDGRTRFRGNDATGRFDVCMERVVKIKILKQSGIDYANFEIPYYMENNDWEKIEILEGNTYNVDDGNLKVNALEGKNVFTEKINASWSKKVFAMPNVRVGSVIEVRYVIVSPYIFNIREWSFQKKIPVVESSYNIRVIPYYEYTYIMKGAPKFDVATSEVDPDEIHWGNLIYKELSYSFGMKNIPAFRDEAFITSEEDYLISLNFQLSKIHYASGGSKSIMTTWPALCEDFLKSDYFGKYIRAAEKEGKKILPLLGLEGKSEQEKIKIISDYVKMGYRWSGEYGKFTSTEKVSNFMKEKSGNDADLNLFLLGLLKAAQIDAQPIILSTRGNGSISEGHPFQQFFNYVIIRTGRGENALFLDATERLLLYNELPDRCVNVRGLVVEEKSGDWINILQDDLALTEKRFEISCNGDHTALNGKIAYSAYAYDAYNYRRKYNGEENNLKELLQKREIHPKGKMDIQNGVELDKPFVFSFETETPLDVASGKLFIPPFFNQSVTENIFKQDNRTLPVDLVHKEAAKYQAIINIPEGYEVEHLPAPLVYDKKLMIINYNAVEKDGKIEVSAEYQLKESVYEARSYPILKALFNEMVKKFNEMVVLKKKETNI